MIKSMRRILTVVALGVLLTCVLLEQPLLMALRKENQALREQLAQVAPPSDQLSKSPSRSSDSQAEVSERKKIGTEGLEPSTAAFGTR